MSVPAAQRKAAGLLWLRYQAPGRSRPWAPPSGSNRRRPLGRQGGSVAPRSFDHFRLPVLLHAGGSHLAATPAGLHPGPLSHPTA